MSEMREVELSRSGKWADDGVSSGPDLRSFLAALEAREPAQIVTVRREVSPHHELAAVVKRFEDYDAPVVIFEHVSGSSLRVVTGVWGSEERIGLALGCTDRSAVATYTERLRNPISPVRVEGGPVKEIRVEGADVDLDALPIGVHSALDAGRYITAGIFLVEDPRTGATNAGIYRLMIQDRKRFTVSVDPGHDLRDIIEWSAANGRDLIDFAVVIGAHPTLGIASQVNTPSDQDAIDVMGGLLGEPVPMVRCDSVGLDVPAAAEIVLEGKIHVRTTQHEGPFGEFTFYYGESDGFVCEVTAVTRRRDAIFVDLHPAHREHRLLWMFPGREAAVLEAVRRVVPGVLDVHVPADAAGMLAYICLRKVHDGDAVLALTAALTIDPIMKYAIVVDPDVDVHRPGDVLWALVLRCQADRDMVVLPNSRGFKEDPSSYARPGRPEPADLTTKAGFDATLPLGRPFPPRADVLPAEYANLNLAEYLDDRWPGIGQ
jgi:2,5-furandicarboxylate decarboxylase 1